MKITCQLPEQYCFLSFSQRRFLYSSRTVYQLVMPKGEKGKKRSAPQLFELLMLFFIRLFPIVVWDFSSLI